MTDRTADDRGRRPRRFLLGALTAAALAVSMSGCVLLKSTSSTQLNTIGKVQITSTVCASDTSSAGSTNAGYNPTPPGDPACQKNVSGGNANAGGNTNSDAGDGSYQPMIAYRIPTGASAPATITTTNATCGSGIVFSQSSSYASQLTSLSPPESGMQWVGYLATTQNYTQAGCQYLTVAPQFTLNQGFGVAPFQGPFKYRVVVGSRIVDGSHLASRTVDCGGTLLTNSNDVTICGDNPDTATIATTVSQPTRDLGVLPTTPGTVHAGATGTVGFNLRYNGAVLPSGNFTLSANTNIPGATATPASPTLSPAADSDNNMNVNVTVPANTTPGNYNVFLVATLSTDNTQIRGGIVAVTLTVGSNFIFDPAPALPSLGTVALNGQAQATTAKMNNFGVNDTTASPSGWNVTVAGDGSGSNKAVFTQYCNNGSNPCGSDPANSYVSGGRNLSANSLSLNSTGANWTGGTGSAPTFQCGGGSCAIDSATPTKVASAANGSSGTGLWTTNNFSNSSVSLATPSTLRVLPANEQYRLNVVWSLNSGP
jgi:hypothetical protein